MDDIKANFNDIRARMAKAEAEAGRKAGTVTLVAVSKVQPDEKIQTALALGQRVFGENRVQEATQRWSPIRPAYPDLVLHLIGSLQTNKAKEAVALFDVIETIDRERLADAVAEQMAKQGKHLQIFLQLNTGEEPQKGGVLPSGLEALYNHCVTKAGLPVAGLMCIPPEHENPVFHFGLLKTWAQRLGLPALSMGMSHDFEDAIKLGATQIRVGSALFGERHYAPKS